MIPIFLMTLALPYVVKKHFGRPSYLGAAKAMATPSQVVSAVKTVKQAKDSGVITNSQSKNLRQQIVNDLQTSSVISPEVQQSLTQIKNTPPPLNPLRKLIPEAGTSFASPGGGSGSPSDDSFDDDLDEDFDEDES